MRTLILAFEVLVLSAVGCANVAEGEDVGTNEDAVVSEADKALVKGCVAGTDPAGCLTQAAQSRLDERLKAVERNLGDTTSGLSGTAFPKADGIVKRAYTISTRDACLAEGNTVTVDRASLIWEQIKESIDFMSIFHEHSAGKPNRLFRSIDVCTARINAVRALGPGGELLMQGSSLVIGTAKSGVLFRGNRVQTFKEIRDRWDRAEMFKGNAVLEKSIGRKEVWEVVNPVSLASIRTRKILESVVKGLVARLDAAKGASDKRSALKALVAENTAVRAKINGKPFGEVAQAVLDKLTDPELSDVIDAWTKNAQSPALPDEALEAFSAAKAKDASCANVDVTQRCAINVQNVHCINVSVSLGAAAVSRFLGSPSDESVSSVRVRQVGLVCVQTNDFIKVDLNVAIQTSSLAQALNL